MPWVPKKIVSGVLFKTQPGVFDNSPRNIDTLKGQHENDCKQVEWRYTTQFSNPAVVEQGADLETSHEGRNSVLLLVAPDIV